MSSLENYLSDTIKLASSFIFKSTDVALQINRQLVINYGTTNVLGPNSTNQETWKYYVNASGNYHYYNNGIEDISTNESIKVISMDDGVEYTLTKTLLETHTLTKKELLKYDIYFSSLVEKYPSEEILIKGIINPADITNIQDIEDGLIISHNPEFLDVNEDYLLREVNNFSYGMFRRWFNREYGIIDNLYITHFLSTVHFPALVLKIKNIRYANIFSYKTHSFHIDNFLASNFYIIDETSSLTHDEKLWLYLNIRYIQQNAGTNSTNRLMLEKLFREKSIPISIIKLINKVPSNISLENNDVSEPIYNNKSTFFIEEAYFSEDDSGNNDSYQSLELLKHETNVDNIGNVEDIDQAPYINDFENNIIDKKAITQPTKDLLVKVRSFNAKSTFINFKTVFDYLIYLVDNGYYSNTIVFTDKSTGVNYTLTPKSAALLIIKIVSLAYGNDTFNFASYRYDGILNSVKDVSTLTDGLLGATYITDIMNDIIVDRPSPTNMNEASEVYAYINACVDFYNLLWTIGTNTHDMVMSADLKYVSNRLTDYGTYDLTVGGEGVSIDTLLSNEGVVFTHNDNYDYTESISDIIYLMTNIELNKNEIASYITNRMKIVSKLSSYTIQFLVESDSYNMKLPFNTNMGSIYGGFAFIESATFIALESFYGTQLSTGDNDGDNTYIYKAGLRLSGKVRNYTPKLVASTPNEYLYRSLEKLDIFGDNTGLFYAPLQKDLFYLAREASGELVTEGDISFDENGYAIFDGQTDDIVLDTTIRQEFNNVHRLSILFSMYRETYVNESGTYKEHHFSLGGGWNWNNNNNRVSIELNYNNEDKIRLRYGKLNDTNYITLIGTIPHVLGEFKIAAVFDFDPDHLVCNLFVNNQLVATTPINSSWFSKNFYYNAYINRILTASSDQTYFTGCKIKNLRFITSGLSLLDIAEADNHNYETVQVEANSSEEEMIVVRELIPHLFMSKT